FLLPIDPANEKPILGVKSEKIYQEVLKTKSLKKNQLYLIDNQEELFEKLLLYLKKNDVVIFAGPGKIAALPHKFINFLKRQNEKKF
ncbi:MAG: hypothetical protein WC320_02430, partial [Candidatus Paceibacterota bacterium]